MGDGLQDDAIEGVFHAHRPRGGLLQGASLLAMGLRLAKEKARR